MNAVEHIKSIRPYDFVMAKTCALLSHWITTIDLFLENWEVIEVEKEFQFPLINPETGGSSKTFVEAGKTDGVLRHKRTLEYAVIEHKTTSDDISTESDYWGRLSMDSQISKYLLNEKQGGRDASTIIYDVIHKPSKRPCQVPILDEQGNKVVLDSSGNRVRTKAGGFRQSASSEEGFILQTRHETPLEYHDRIYKCIADDICGHYSQREIPRSDTDMLEYMSDAWSVSQQILHYRRQNIWPRNPDACIQFGTCEFFSLCLGRDSVDGVHYRTVAAHPELEVKPDKMEFLTNSRIRTLRSCSKKHFLKYESPTERVGDEDENLAVGSLFHIGAQHHLQTKIKK